MRNNFHKNNTSIGLKRLELRLAPARLEQLDQLVSWMAVVRPEYAWSREMVVSFALQVLWEEWDERRRKAVAPLDKNKDSTSSS